MKKLIRKLFAYFGYEIVKPKPEYYEVEFLDIYSECKEFTCTSIERMYALYQAVNYIVKNNIPGVFVECGVWKGGSCMLIAKTLIQRKSLREIYLFDTFSGMTTPTSCDVDCSGKSAESIMKKNNGKLSDIPIEQVRRNLLFYPKELLHFVIGDVRNTVFQFDEEISLLRLDTDWYDSTRDELKYLYPRLELGGVLIIDDYGHWMGAKKAVDEYFCGTVLLNRIDYTGRLIVRVI
jgi:O-methyltransferase